MSVVIRKEIGTSLLRSSVRPALLFVVYLRCSQAWHSWRSSERVQQRTDFAMRHSSWASLGLEKERAAGEYAAAQ